MKKKLLALSLLAAIILSLSGCSTQQKSAQSAEIPAEEPQSSTQSTVDWVGEYRPVLDAFYQFIFENTTEQDSLFGSVGVSELLHLAERADTLRSVGYAMEDLSGDGTPELLIGGIDPDDPQHRGSEVYVVYSCTDGAPQGLLQGWSRSSYRLTKDGGFFYCGSSGAMYSAFGSFRLNEDASELVCDAFCFCEPDETGIAPAFYQNSSGLWDASVSEPVYLTDDSFRALADEMEAQVSPIVFTPFAEYFIDDVRVQDANEIPYEVSGTSVTLSDSDYAMRLVFFAEDAVTDFRISALSYETLDESGNPTLTDEVYSQSELTADTPLTVTLSFPGDLPCYAVSYVDDAGNTLRFLLEQSGMDGLIFLGRF